MMDWIKNILSPTEDWDADLLRSDGEENEGPLPPDKTIKKVATQAIQETSKEEKISTAIKNINYQCDLLVLGAARVAKVEAVYQFVLPGKNREETGFYEYHGNQLKSKETREDLEEATRLRRLTNKDTIDKSSSELKRLKDKNPDIDQIRKECLSWSHHQKQAENKLEEFLKKQLNSKLEEYQQANTGLDVAELDSLKNSFLEESVQQFEAKLDKSSMQRLSPSFSLMRERFKILKEFKEANRDFKLDPKEFSSQQRIKEALQKSHSRKIEALKKVSDFIAGELNQETKTVGQVSKGQEEKDLTEIQGLIEKINNSEGSLEKKKGANQDLDKIRELVLIADQKVIKAHKKDLRRLENKTEKVFNKNFFDRVAENLDFKKTEFLEIDSVWDKVGKTTSWVCKMGLLGLCHAIYNLTDFFTTGYIRRGIEEAEQTMIEYVEGLENEKNNQDLRELIFKGVKTFLEKFDTSCREIGEEESSKSPDATKVKVDKLIQLDQAIESKMAKLVSEKDPQKFLQDLVRVILTESMGGIGAIPRELILSLLQNSKIAEQIFNNLKSCLTSREDGTTFALDKGATELLEILEEALRKAAANEGQPSFDTTRHEKEAVTDLGHLLLEALEFGNCQSKEEVKKVYNAIKTKESPTEAKVERTWLEYLGDTASNMLKHIDVQNASISEATLKDNIVTPWIEKSTVLISNEVRELLKPETSLELIGKTIDKLNWLLFTNTPISREERVRAREDRERTTERVMGALVHKVTKKTMGIQSEWISNRVTPAAKTVVGKVINFIAKDSTILYLFQTMIDEKWLNKVKEEKEKKRNA